MKKLINVTRDERGSLALEQILFIGAIVTMAVGLFAFYGNLGSFFTNFDVNAAASNGGGNG